MQLVHNWKWTQILCFGYCRDWTIISSLQFYSPVPTSCFFFVLFCFLLKKFSLIKIKSSICYFVHLIFIRLKCSASVWEVKYWLNAKPLIKYIMHILVMIIIHVHDYILEMTRFSWTSYDKAFLYRKCCFINI